MNCKQKDEGNAKAERDGLYLVRDGITIKMNRMPPATVASVRSRSATNHTSGVFGTF